MPVRVDHVWLSVVGVLHSHDMLDCLLRVAMRPYLGMLAKHCCRAVKCSVQCVCSSASVVLDL
jgi:hypothetical protein